MTPDDDAALLLHLAALRDRCMATMSAIGEIQLRLARRAADRAETARIERDEFGPTIRDSLDDDGRSG
jgi:hypothetical protein